MSASFIVLLNTNLVLSNYIDRSRLANRRNFVLVVQMSLGREGGKRGNSKVFLASISVRDLFLF